MLKLKNDGATTLAADINSTVTSIPVVDGSVFPTLAEGDWFPLTLIKNSNVERMRVIARDGNTLTVTRGVEGTSAQSWVSGDNCTCNLTAEAIAEIMIECDASAQAVETMKTTVEAARDTTIVNANAAQNSANAAATSKVDAETAASTATTKASEAAGSAATAEAHKNSAAQITGLDNVTQAVDLALADVPFNAMSEVEFEAMREQNNEQYAASGFVHFGKHYSNAVSEVFINQGLNTNLLEENILRFGRRLSDGIGDSAVAFPEVNVAGVVTQLKELSYSGTIIGGHIKFPEAPNGTVTYDSATGVITDFTKDVDPKYGDVAANTNEAVARAFEGLAKNGDFRLGDDGSWGASTTQWTVSGGEASWLGDGVSGNADLTSASIPAGTYTTGDEIEVTCFIENKTTAFGIYGTNVGVVEADYNTVEGLNRKTFIIEDGSTDTNIKFRGQTTLGTTATVKNVSIRKVTNEVVTERIDMYGFEAYLEQVTEANPFVYPKGLIQSQATTMNGIATTTSNRPVTYCAVYDGDTGSQGKGVDYFAASAADKAKMVADPKNNIVIMNNGDVCQWRIRQRTIAGAGNGDWENVTSIGGPLAWNSASSQEKRVGIQGSADVVAWTGSGNSNHYYGEMGGGVREVGTFTAYSGAGEAINSYNGLAFFLVLGTVPRLNQGAYHPSLNPMGTRMFKRLSEDSGGAVWYSSLIDYTPKVVECFKVFAYGTINKGAYISSGRIVDGSTSGRSDSRAYNAIYAGGQGGVIDYRLPAHDMSTAEKAAEIDAKVKNGTYRGVEKLVYSYVATHVYASSPAKTYINATSGDYTLVVGDKFWVYDRTLLEWVSREITSISGGQAQFNDQDTIHINEDDLIIYEMKTNISVSGEFTQTDVIGDPANILQCDALKDGWIGSWIPVIPDDTGKTFSLSRKSLGLSNATVYTEDIGVTWGVSSFNAHESVMNSMNGTSDAPSIPLNRVMVLNYTAFAKQTKESTNLPVLHGEAGLGSVFRTSSSKQLYSVLLGETLLGKVFSDVEYSSRAYTLHLLATHLPSDYLGTSSIGLTHAPLSAVYDVGPANNSTAVKALMYQTESNSQANLNYAFNELVWDTDNWGDDSTIHIADGTDTDTDDNGNTRLIGTHELALPYGWVRNTK